MIFKAAAFTIALGLSSLAFATTRTHGYASGPNQFEGLVAEPTGMAGKKAPLMILIPSWLGVTEKTKAVAQKLADLGFVVLAADVYGKGVRPRNPQEAGEVAGRYRSDRALFRERLRVAYEEGKRLPNVDTSRIVALGYCFGGTAALELARSGVPLWAAVSFHGGLDSPKPADGANIKAKIVAFHGADDPRVAANDLEAFENEMRTHKVDWTLVKFGGAVHSFTEPEAGNDPSRGSAYDAQADARSWEMLKMFLDEE